MVDLTLPALHAAYAQGASVADVVGKVYARIAQVNDPGIFIHLLDEADVLAVAKALPPFDPSAFPLWGIPFAVKDNVDVAGLPTTAACPDFAYTAGETAHAVTRLLNAGALLIGKTNLDQFATGLVGVRTPYPIPKNAIDPALIPGGSSSGSAVAVGQGIVTFALGTDTAGSGRVPAALNRIVGLKPTKGSVSFHGVVPACRSLDCLSVFAGTVGDSYTVFEVMRGFDADDIYSRAFAKSPIGLPPKVRLGIPSKATIQFYGDDLAQAAFDVAVSVARGQGWDIIEIDMSPFYEVANLLYEGAWVAERYQALRDFIKTNVDSFHPVTRQITLGAERLSAADAFAGLYRLEALKRVTTPVWGTIDAMMVPTMPTAYTVDEVLADPIRTNSRNGTYTNFVNLLDLCGMAVPGPFKANGKPAGVTFLAPGGQDGLTAALGRAIHHAIGGEIGATGVRVGAVSPKPVTVPAGFMELSVVGAHLSGMALNGQLTSRGAMFLRQAATAPDYQLYALAGGPPFRPGLQRVETGQGTSIALEVWAVPEAEIGSFLAGIPVPLGLGTVKLADGSTVKGFICESEGLKGAEDISCYGGWRAYQAALLAASSKPT